MDIISYAVSLESLVNITSFRDIFEVEESCIRVTVYDA